MRTRVVLIAAVLGVLLLAGAGAVYAYDQAKAEQIGEGVRIGGVDVSGLSPEQARAKLRRAVLDPLSKPVVVRALGKRYRLSPEQAAVAVDVEGSVEAALDRSREGNMLVRTWRGIRGESLEADLELDIDYSKRSIARLVRRVQKNVDEPAVDASVDLENGSVEPQPSKEGRRLLAKKLKRQVRKRLLDVGAVKTVKARTEVVEPEVTTEELGEKYPAVLVVNRGSFQLTLYKQLKLAKTYSVAIGAVGFDTPAGLYHIQNKAVNPAWTMPELGLGRPGGPRHGGPRRSAREPAQGALDGDLRRRRHPRHRRDRLDRHRRVARLRADADP